MADLDATTTAAEIPEAAYVAATLALHGDCSCESPDEHEETSEGCSSLAEIALIAAWPTIKTAIAAEATARERQRIRQLAIDYWHNVQHTREGYVPGWFALIMDGDDDA